jgi:2-polyprenyl-6-methoxyphenol hydroxylase-like FAD-dependent oxidoreductase
LIIIASAWKETQRGVHGILKTDIKAAGDLLIAADGIRSIYGHMYWVKRS